MKIYLISTYLKYFQVFLSENWNIYLTMICLNYIFWYILSEVLILEKGYVSSNALTEYISIG